MKYRKKPVEVEAIQFEGTLESVKEIKKISPDKIDAQMQISGNEYTLYIKTKEGVMTAKKGDYIITGVMGEVYPCHPKIFNLTYEVV